ncbi:MAG TPA: TatD family deoxyribonuclease [Sulfurovum sp.]|nr:TatD family deoxyribonuclease [Sulfurovum sp.]
MIIDTHCHLDDDRYIDDLDAVISRAKGSGVERYIVPGADPASLQRAVELSEKYEDIYFAVGVHPYHALDYDRRLLDKYVTHEKCVAVGECGLDYYRLPEDEDDIRLEKIVQKEIFIDQVALAKENNKPLIIHIRDASRDSQEILEKYTGEKGGVLHCYNADHELLSLLDKNFYYGIGGVLTFKNAKKLVEVYPRIPLDRLLIETDGPYLTPHPHRGERNEPAYCALVAKKMAELSDMEQSEIERISTQNCKRLFGI